jgi:hypothetical protein
MLEVVRIGVVQTTLNAAAAWAEGGVPKMQAIEEQKAENEVDNAIRLFASSTERPHIVLIPELACPRHVIGKLQQHANRLEAVIIAGMDYRLDVVTKSARNEAMLFLPSKWLGNKTMSPSVSRRIGKTYPAHRERLKLEQAGWKFECDPVVWLFDGGDVGNFAVAICFDFLDLERLALYRGRIHHFFLLAYNNDMDSFNHAAEALARMAACNVVVCNTGFYGGSVAVSPYRKRFRRTIYRSEGAKLFSAQVIELPVKILTEHQKAAQYDENSVFKALPPGFSEHVELQLKDVADKL